MRALVCERPGHVALRELPEPVPGPGEVVVRVESALTCGTDLKLIRRGHPKVPFPTVLGHEYCGRVARVGEGAPFAVGERVVSGVSGPCGACHDCRGGRPNHCPTAFDHAVWGTWAEETRIPARVVASTLCRVPDALSSDAAALLDPLASVLRGLSRLPDPSGRTVLVLGSGPIALLFTALLLRRGAGRVVVAGRNAARLAAHASLGAETISARESLGPQVLVRSGARGAEIVVETTGALEVAEEAPSLAARGGMVLLFAGLAREARLAVLAHRVHYDEVTLAGSFHYTPEDTRTALDLLSRGELPVGLLVTSESSLEKHPFVLERLSRGEEMKVAFRP
ncbi:MAG TPA: alcohol dehydrogenase catalytic domain-containing protein [Thermoanaerobaculia bacterium]|jgi:L-iditol 2-dehydrogenase|nr:alcohol dehydrogenase catalytic domain-containing protein [Thermoanaerobaculia bacterium]HPA52657.1 alcohol dehydrogenase catalytic domain-containing protein [Thermoanaerobaculia bacterium]HQN08122.1 alcohol dehydrogenase catalytic domain-containing protein [Thermoanaerobaculia bacterium]HQP86222.1 alcohol dehydrogenase catalytic domain-containing protein [Thermoanaerobaculia bacterium]